MTLKIASVCDNCGAIWIEQVVKYGDIVNKECFSDNWGATYNAFNDILCYCPKCNEGILPVVTKKGEIC